MKAAISALVLLAVLGSAVAAFDESRAHMRRLLNTDANVGARTFKVGAANPNKVKDPASVDTSKLAFARLEKAALIPQTPKRLLMNTDFNNGPKAFKVTAANPQKVVDAATADTSKLAFARLEKAEARPAPQKAAVVSKTPAKPKRM